MILSCLEGVTAVGLQKSPRDYRALSSTEPFRKVWSKISALPGSDCWAYARKSCWFAPTIQFEMRHYRVRDITYAMAMGPIPRGATLRHVGREVGWCCNPSHWKALTVFDIELGQALKARAEAH